MLFRSAEPRTLREAVSLLKADGEPVRAIAGGTALMLMMKAGVFVPRRLVSLRAIEPRHGQIELMPDGGLRIGAMATLRSLEHSAAVRQAAPVITRTLKTLSNVRVRNVATAGGHLAHGDPHMDLPPVLTALGAHVRTLSPAGERQRHFQSFHIDRHCTLPVSRCQRLGTAFKCGHCDVSGEGARAQPICPLRAGQRRHAQQSQARALVDEIARSDRR